MQFRLSFRARFVPFQFPLHSLTGWGCSHPFPSSMRGALHFPSHRGFAPGGEVGEDLGAEQRRKAGGCLTRQLQGIPGTQGHVGTVAWGRFPRLLLKWELSPGSHSPPAPGDPQANHWFLFFSLPICEMGAANPIYLPGGARLPAPLCNVLRDPRANGRVLPGAVGCPRHA